ncbi:MAG: hypothetical protein HFF77_03165 [Oscillospiraceae bacterium]|jgi:hypothetical protein|nr:hypothetical protein [Oscillospiraceae bacterium]
MRNIPARDRYAPQFGVVPGRDYRYICPLCGEGIDWPGEPMDKNAGGQWCHDKCLYQEEDYGYSIE